MKNIICAFVLVMFFSSIAGAQTNGKKRFVLTVDISRMQPKPEKIIISYYDYGVKKLVTDTANATSDRLIFKGELGESVQARINQYPAIQAQVEYGQNVISSKGSVPSYVGTSFFLEPGKVKVIVKDSIKSIEVSGSAAHKAYEQLQNLKKPYMQKQRELMSKIAAYTKNKDSVNLANANELYKANIAELREKVYKPYILKHANKTPVVLIAVQEFSEIGRASYNEFETIFNSISLKYQSLPSAVAIKQRAFTYAFTSIGAIAPDFTQNDTLGKPVTLSSFRGKYVLLDFWASWCGPCRKENPNLVKSFNRFKDKGFTVLAVSLDQPGKKDAWMKAIHDDQLTWTHVSDLTFWSNAVAKMYGVTGVPSNFLIDPQGKIVARNLRGEFLDKKLEELLGK